MEHTKAQFESARKKANEIVSRYGSHVSKHTMAVMHAELAEIGVTVGTIYNDDTHCEWHLHGEEHPNSWFVCKIEYINDVAFMNAYFS